MNLNYNFGKGRLKSPLPTQQGLDERGCCPPSSPTIFERWYAFLTLMVVFLINHGVSAQVSAYTFAQSTATYTAVSSPTTVFSSGWDESVSPVTIPFTFAFNGTPYTSCNVSTNGFITFGTTAPSSGEYYPISTTTGYNGAVAAFGNDLLDNTGAAVVTGVSGTSPNRVFIIQWTNAKRFNINTFAAINGDALSFQIRLYENGNKVELMYGACAATSSSNGFKGEVGLRGATAADFNNRSGGNNTAWNALSAGTSNSNNVNYKATVLPASGLTFTWTPPVPPACGAPISLAVTDITATTADIAWAAPLSGTPATYDWEIRTSGAGGSGASGLTTSGNTTAPTVSVNDVPGLTTNTTYNLYVRTNCSGGAGSSTWAGPVSFTTPKVCPSGLGAGSVTISSLPYSASGLTNSGAGDNVTGTNVVCVAGSSSYYGGLDKTYIFTPVISGVYTILLTTGSDDDAGIMLYQGCPFTAGSTCVANAQSTTGLTRTLTPTLTSGVTYYLVVDNFPSPAFVGSYSLSISLPPTCGVPTGLAVTDITGATADIAWVAPVTGTPASYDWEIRTSGVGGSGASGLTTSGSTTSPTVSVNDVPGLAEKTAYNLYVRTNCSGGAGSSTWAGPVAFTTTLNCAAATVITANTPVVSGNLGTTDGIYNPPSTSCGFSTPGNEKLYTFTTTSAGNYTLSITSSAGSGYIDYFYKLASGGCGPTGWTCIGDANAAEVNTLTGLAASTTYFILLDAEANSGTANQTFQIIPPPTCGVPTGLAVTDITATTADIAWVAPVTGTPASYDWEIRTSGAGGSGASGLTTSGSTTSPTVSVNDVPGLTGKTAYSLYVRTNCSGGAGSSTWAGPVAFTTALDCSAATVITLSTPVVSGNLGTTGGIYNPPATSCGFSTPGNEKLYTFTTTSAGNYILNITSSAGSGYIDYFYKLASGGCGPTGWTCIGDANAAEVNTLTGLAASTTYFILLDAESASGTANQTFQIDLGVPPSCATNVAPANGATNVATGSVALSWTAPTSGSAPASYDVYFGTTSGSLTLAGNTTSLTYSASAPAYSTTYYWRIVPKNSGGSATGCSESSFTTGPNPFLPYCSSITYTEDVEPITSVSFAGINNTSSNTVNGSPAIENFIAVTGNVTVGNSYPMTLKGNTAGNFTTNFRVFVDWNHDGDFADADEVFNAGSVTNSTGLDAVSAASTIAVPANALPGTTRMRIKKLFSVDSGSVTNPCTGGEYGQTEDYSLVVRLKWYADADSDGFGNPAVMVESATNPGGYVLNNTDCNDNQVQYADVDGDGFGSTTMVACGGVLNNTDCDDNQLRYADLDGDGFGATTLVACGGVTVNGDCNDANNTVYPNAPELCYDGLDNDCDGTIDEGCTPIISVIQGTQCGSTLTSISQQIYANLVPNAQGYRFRVTDMSTNQVQTIDRALRVFQLTQLTNYAFDRTYQVEVSIRYNNVWQPFYGAPCQVTTPATTTKVQTAQCGGTLTTMSDVIYADNVPYATGYKFRITNLLTSAQQEIERPLRDVRMNQTTIAEFNTTYTVEVAIRNTNGAYLPYGPVCNVTTPSFPTSQLQLSQCDVIITNPTTTIYADSYSGATTYRFRFVNSALGYTYQFDRPIRSFALSSVPGLVAGETYSVQVSIEINGVFGPYGKVCTITTPGNTKASTGKPAVDFTAVAAPNPFGENFRLEVSTSSEESIHVSVYDMLGKLIENRNVEASAITELEVGANYPSGVYNVIVSQGEEVKTLRVIKR